jgi:NAD(P)H-hydrate epimerase
VIPLLSRAQIRAFDAHAIQACAVPSLLLMENAARGATEVLVSHLLGGQARGKRVVLLCGTGNNGGDGFAIARRLLVLGAVPSVVFLGEAAALTPDAQTNLDAYRGVGGAVTSTLDRSLLAAADAIVDAIFGTGLSRPVTGALADAIAALAPFRDRVLAVDVPSGLDAERGVVLGACVRAAVTATFAHWKLGLATPIGADYTGRIVVCDIGVPAGLVAAVGASGDLIEASDVRAWLPARPKTSHKYTSGHVGVLAGSPGKVGAARLVARGAHRAGAGAVTVATWEGGEDGEWLETMTSPLRRSSIAVDVEALVARKAAIACGPGLGLDADAKLVVERVLGSGVPVVLDADALTLFAGNAAAFAVAKRCVVTPHTAEAARLLGVDVASVEADRFAAARTLAAQTRGVVLLKGAYTVVAEGPRLAVVGPGSVALATAGSGDVLAGAIAAMLAVMPPFEAACAGAYLHARSGEWWEAGHADRGMMASDIADGIPGVVGALIEEPPLPPEKGADH